MYVLGFRELKLCTQVRFPKLILNDSLESSVSMYTTSNSPIGHIIGYVSINLMVYIGTAHELSSFTTL
jgi:hypothetical protein